MPKPNKSHLPSVTRVVIHGGLLVPNVAPSRCKPDEILALAVVNDDSTDYQIKMTNFKDKGANVPVNESDLFVAVYASHKIAKRDVTAIQRTVKPKGNWGPGQFAYTTYEFTLELWNANLTTKLDDLDPDFDITP